jgi:hypothetical protein
VSAGALPCCFRGALTEAATLIESSPQLIPYASTCQTAPKGFPLTGSAERVDADIYCTLMDQKRHISPGRGGVAGVSCRHVCHGKMLHGWRLMGRVIVMRRGRLGS